jgi:hypothetical protein
MYAYPHTVLPELTTFLREHPKAVKYLDIPIQHISSPMLKAMKRGVSGEQVRGILDRLRDEVPGIAVRSTLIAGFPGETEADFQAAKELVAELPLRAPRRVPVLAAKRTRPRTTCPTRCPRRSRRRASRTDGAAARRDARVPRVARRHDAAGARRRLRRRSEAPRRVAPGPMRPRSTAACCCRRARPNRARWSP